MNGMVDKTFTIYTRDHCSYCVLAKKLLNEHSATYTEKDISNPEVLKELRNLYPEARTVPQIFQGDEHIGGYTELLSKTHDIFS